MIFRTSRLVGYVSVPWRVNQNKTSIWWCLCLWRQSMLGMKISPFRRHDSPILSTHHMWSCTYIFISTRKFKRIHIHTEICRFVFFWDPLYKTDPLVFSIVFFPQVFVKNQSQTVHNHQPCFRAHVGSDVFEKSQILMWKVWMLLTCSWLVPDFLTFCCRWVDAVDASRFDSLERIALLRESNGIQKP